MLEAVRRSLKSISILGLNGKLYIFGSSMYKNEPSDIDLLLVINELVMDSRLAYRQAKPMTDKLYEDTGLPIDLTILTTAENMRSSFIDLVAARLVHEFTDDATQHHAFTKFNQQLIARSRK